MLTFSAIGLVIGFALIIPAAVLYNAEGKRSTSNAFGFSGLGVFTAAFCMLLLSVSAPAGSGTQHHEVPIDIEFNGPGVVQPEKPQITV